MGSPWTMRTCVLPRCKGFECYHVHLQKLARDSVDKAPRPLGKGRVPLYTYKRRSCRLSYRRSPLQSSVNTFDMERSGSSLPEDIFSGWLANGLHHDCLLDDHHPVCDACCFCNLEFSSMLKTLDHRSRKRGAVPPPLNLKFLERSSTPGSDRGDTPGQPRTF